MHFHCCFLNCDDLYEPEVNAKRANLDEEALQAKLRGLSAMLHEAADGNTPDLIGLCEVGSEEIGERLATTIHPNRYGSIWSGIPFPHETGLQVLYNKDLFAQGRVVNNRWTQGESARTKWMAVRLECQQGTRGLLWLVVHHWQSPRAGEDAPTERQHLWGELNVFYKSEARIEADAMIMIGDFNCEPGDAPLVRQPGQVLVTTRERELAIRGLRDGLFLYNPMWRLMGEEHPHEDTLEPGYTSSRPLGTFSPNKEGASWRMVDQMFVSSSLLGGPYFRLLEKTLRISRYQRTISDHSAIGATFVILEG